VVISALREENKVTLGFHRYHDHSIAPVASCLLLSPILNKVYQKLPDVLPQLLPRGVQVDIALQVADNNAVDCVIGGLEEREEARLGAKQTALVAELAEYCGLRRVSFKITAQSEPKAQIELEKMTKTSGALTVDLSPAAFLQPSEEGEEALCKAVMDALGKRSKKDKVLDLFSGCGTFAGRILEKCAVHAVEHDFGMSAALKQAAKGHARFTAEARDLFKEPMSVREMRDYAAVVFDPPRAGASAQCQKLAKSEIPLLIAVSCNPSTFARDAKILLGGGYKLKSLQIFDQFIYTTHTELVAVFVR
jgi:23S rRNA (uracil1939-C5)-methyltransferase